MSHHYLNGSFFFGILDLLVGTSMHIDTISLCVWQHMEIFCLIIFLKWFLITFNCDTVTLYCDPITFKCDLVNIKIDLLIFKVIF